MDVTIRKPASEAEKDWAEDDDRYFNDEWEEELSIVVPHCSSEDHLIAEVDGELCVIKIIAPHMTDSLVDKIKNAILEVAAEKS